MAGLTTAHAENAILECTAESHADDRVLLQFRVSAIEGSKVGKALLLLHVSGKMRAGKIQLAPITSPWKEGRFGKEVEVEEQVRPDGWISAIVPAQMVQALVERKAYGLAVRDVRQRFDSRATVQYSPYLVVQSERAVKNR